jgi:mannosyl-3-phosphoglycerate phosphatase
MSKIIIFTDLDGTLLDSGYSFQAALPALSLIKDKNIPLILCSSKTRIEIEYYRQLLDNHDPFISENGGGIFIPKGYFKLDSDILNLESFDNNEYYVFRLGERYEVLRNAIEELRIDGFDIKGFGDMSVREVAELTGLTLLEAKMAKSRDFDEPFIFYENERRLQQLFNTLKVKGFNVARGDLHHILGNSDKGRAVSILKGLYRNKFKNITTVAIGDSPNDIPMLQNVDLPAVVRKPNGEYDPLINMPNITKVAGIGPEGWNGFVLNLINNLYTNNQQ